MAAAAVTTRDRFEKSHTGPACRGCHQAIDGIGFGLEGYDAVGRFRTTDNGAPVNAKGTIPFSSGPVPFDGAVELGPELAASAQVRDCVVSQWLSYAAGTSRDEIGTCTSQPAIRAFAAHGLDLPELLVGIVISPSFRLRPSFTP
jgi:hypothetical protein